MNQLKRPDVEKVLASLKDFQRSSVDYVFDRLFGTGATNRFLLADEVGLGKTLVARGVIAKAVDHLWRRKKRIDIAYICSNADIARQNINRLNITSESHFQLASRLTLLPMKVRDLERNKLNFISLTPGTSFNLRSSLGTGNERWLLYWLLRKAWPKIRGAGPMNVLEGGMSRANFRRWIRDYKPRKFIDAALARAFVRDLKAHDRRARALGEVTYRRRFSSLCKQFQRKREGRASADLRHERAALVGELRSLLAATCIRALKPDLVILDEFQRFKDLLRGESEAGQLARHLFNAADTRVLLLSATPYKMYTLSHEAEQDDHYADFLDTLRFLYDDGPQAKQLEELLRDYRKGLYRLAHGHPAELLPIKDSIENHLRTVIARTERLAVTADRDGMLREVVRPPATLTSSDVHSYTHLQRLARLLEQGQTVEYWKSAPYLLNFMEDYELKRRFRRHKDNPALGAELLSSNGTLLPWQRLKQYEQIDAGNPRLRQLMDDLVKPGMWQLLWLAPSLPYYKLTGPFADARRQRMTKRLVFSSWHVVPRALSVLLSYEVERQMMGLDPTAPKALSDYAKRSALLNFTRSDGRLTGMPVLGLLYPSVVLAEHGDPLTGLTPATESAPPDAEVLAAEVQRRLARPLQRLVDQHAHMRDQREDESWYWAAPILLDQQADAEATQRWFDDPNLPASWSGDAGEEGWAEHVEEARRLLAGERELGRPPTDLLAVLAKLAIAGPAVCALRAIGRVTTGEPSPREVELRHAAGVVAWGFRSLFNLPATISLLRGLDGREPYWERVLDYALAGCLQSVLDAYAHVLRESLGVMDAEPVDAGRQIPC